MTFGLCFRIHTPRLRRTPLKGDSRWRCVGRHVVEYGKICDYGTSKNTKDTIVGMCYRVLKCLLYVEKHEYNNYDVSCTMML